MRALEKLLTSQSQSSHEGSHRQPSQHQPSSSSPHSPAHPLAARSQLSAPAPPPRCLQHIHLPNTHLPPPPTTPLLALPCASAPHRLARPPLTTPRPSAHSTLHSPLRPPAFEQRLAYEPRSRSSKTLRIPLARRPTTSHTLHTQREPAAWSSPRHDWHSPSHRISSSTTAGPADAPTATTACALASTLPYHAIARPCLRTRLNPRRPHRSRTAHWWLPRRTPAGTSLLRRRLSAQESGESSRPTLHKPLWAPPQPCTHPAAIFLPAEGRILCCTAVASRTTARVTSNRGQGSGRLGAAHATPTVGSAAAIPEQRVCHIRPSACG